MHDFLMPQKIKDCEDDVDDESSIGLETIGWNYHDDDIPLVNDAVGSGKYSATLLLNQTGKVNASVKWSDNDKQVLKKKIGFDFIYAIHAYGKSKGWMKPSVHITGYTSIRKPDLTQNCEVTYRSDSDFRGREWIDWAFIHFEDSSKGEDEVNIGRLLGFFHFEDRGFPTPRNLENDFVEDVFDPTMYIVVRCCGEYKNFDRKFVTEFQLMDGGDSLYILPAKSIVGPAAVVPNIYRDFRYRDDRERWLAILPYRKWASLFSSGIGWQGEDDEHSAFV